MMITPQTGQLLRSKAFGESILQATARRSFVRSTPLRQRPELLQRITTRPLQSPKSSRSWTAIYRNLLSQRLRNLRFNSTGKAPRPDPTPNLGSPEPKRGLTARLKKLSKDYGWVALGVYLGLSLLDFPLCFLAVRLAGPERIGRIEHSILSTLGTVFAPVWEVIKPVAEPILDTWRKGKAQVAQTASDSMEAVVREGGEEALKMQAQEAKVEKASIWTQLALAYGIHKTLLIFVRVPLTAAITPKIARILQSYGYKVGKKVV